MFRSEPLAIACSERKESTTRKFKLFQWRMVFQQAIHNCKSNFFSINNAVFSIQPRFKGHTLVNFRFSITLDFGIYYRVKDKEGY
jgi:hypothetical protein